MTPLPQAPRYIRFHGREILRGVGFLKGTIIRCPGGHVISPDSFVLHGVLFCDQRLGDGRHLRDASSAERRHHAQCGALIYMIAMPSAGNPLHRIWLADLTREEWREMQRIGLTDPDSVFHYFGAAFER